MKLQLEKKAWWEYLEHDLQELLQQSLLLSEIAKKWGRDPSAHSTSSGQEFHDYAFVVFPAAKAYEGFLKKLFLDLGFITENDYYGKRFRVGKALNPSLPSRLRKREGVYDKLVDFCGNENLADKLWHTWKKGRNLVFHWFPNEKNAVDMNEAVDRLNMIVDAMDSAFKECKMDKDAS
ncbi:hypothetical protein IID21_00880 [Patescibacteria group bacterium]|nr:hypothetical protein [Patescibacteria group bacterium]